MAAADTWLQPDEIVELTGKKRWTAQCRMLSEMHIPFRPNAVGRPLVERAAVLTTKAQPKKSVKGPNWSAIRGPAST